MILAAFVSFALLVVAWLVLPSPTGSLEPMERIEMESEEASVAA